MAKQASRWLDRSYNLLADQRNDETRYDYLKHTGQDLGRHWLKGLANYNRHMICPQRNPCQDMPTPTFRDHVVSTVGGVGAIRPRKAVGQKGNLTSPGPRKEPNLSHFGKFQKILIFRKFQKFQKPGLGISEIYV